MKTFCLFIVTTILPLFLYSQTDLTIAPDSVYFVWGSPWKATVTVSNNTNQPVNLLQVQSQCAPCQGGWGWWVDSISVTTPHFIYPGQSISLILGYWTIVKDESQINFLHDSMYIVSSVGNQYCHIFLDPSLISSINEPPKKSFSVFPNPIASRVTVRLNDNLNEPGLLSIYNSKGIKITESELFSEDTEIATADLPKGMYLFKVTKGNFSAVQKVYKTY
ncbi:MAG: T9SS type A sorting domain-containing protein [Bacteroidetes bacterium]|nr:T9SS type A sorting domain-containing protein [Bacteroidota bacterium]